MLYQLLGRAIWRVIRGYVRYRYPHARRNAAMAGALTLAGAVAFTAARRRSGD